MDYPKVKVCLDTSEDNLIDELYTPCLKWAERFDRGVGYFTTGWLTYNVAGLSDFASRGGKMRLITSPILSTEDTDAIIGAENQDGSAFLRLEAALLENVEISFGLLECPEGNLRAAEGEGYFCTVFAYWKRHKEYDHEKRGGAI